MLAEAWGTFILVLFGVGSVAISVWTGAYGLWVVSLMFAIGVFIGVYASAKISGGHLNPAVTIAVAAFTDFEWKKVIPYIIAQLLGAFVAAFFIWLLFDTIAANFEAVNGLVRGQAGSQVSMMGYATFAPNPAIIGTDTGSINLISNWQWFVSEALMTSILLFGIFFLTDPNNTSAPQSNLAPVFIAMLVAALIAFEAPLSMTALNPARDIGPRIFAAIAGWGEIAFPGPKGGWWIPTVSTIVGGLLGGAFYHLIYKKAFNEQVAEIGRGKTNEKIAE